MKFNHLFSAASPASPAPVSAAPAVIDVLGMDFTPTPAPISTPAPVPVFL